MFPIHCRLMLLTALQSASLDPAKAGLTDNGDAKNCEKLGSCACTQTGIIAAKAKPTLNKNIFFIDFFMSSY